MHPKKSEIGAVPRNSVIVSPPAGPPQSHHPPSAPAEPRHPRPPRRTDRRRTDRRSPIADHRSPGLEHQRQPAVLPPADTRALIVVALSHIPPTVLPLSPFLQGFEAARGFYIPGVAPVEYKDGDVVDVKAVKMTSTKHPLPYEYYHLPFCQPEKLVRQLRHHFWIFSRISALHHPARAVIYAQRSAYTYWTPFGACNPMV